MSFSWLSIMGMYEYDPSIMDGLNVPTGINREDVINNIMLECAELEIIYPNFETMKQAISIWSNSNQISWNKLYKTMTIEYNPIWNVDADITETIDRNRKDIGSGTGINSVKGFNSDTWADASKDQANTQNDTDEDIVRTERRTGNIGVTASQDLIKKEREIADFNMINYITQSFKKRFCLMVY